MLLEQNGWFHSFTSPTQEGKIIFTCKRAVGVKIATGSHCIILQPTHRGKCGPFYQFDVEDNDFTNWEKL